MSLCVFFFVSNNFKVFAYENTVYSGNYLTYYAASGEVDGLLRQDIIAYGIANNAIHYTDNSNTPSINVGYIASYDYFTNFYNYSGFDLMTNCPYLTSGNSYGNYNGEYDLTGWNTIILSSNENMTAFVSVLRIQSDGNVALVDGNYIVSDSPMQVYVGEAGYNTNTSLWEQNNLWQGYATCPRMSGSDQVNTNFNNLYTWQVPQNMYSYNIVPQIVFTDLDMFYSGDDYFPFTQASFSFDNRQDYFNYNYVKVNGQITNPNDPVIVPVNQNAISNLTFRDSTFYGGSEITNFYHSNRFTFNDYQLSNPYEFGINFDYYITYQDSTMSSPETFRYYHPATNQPGKHESLGWFLGYLNRFGNPTLVELSSNHFYTDSGIGDSSHSLSYYINRTINTVTGTSITYADPDSILESAIISATETASGINGFLFGYNSLSDFASIVPTYGAYISKFEIRGYVNITYSDNPNYISGTYSDYYNFLTGENNVTSQDNTNNNYPSDLETNLPIPSQGGSVGNTTNTGGGSIAYGGNVTFNGIVQRVFEPFALDTVTVAGVGDNWNYMIRSIQDNSENGFWGVLKETYQIIPDEIWGWLIAAVSAILGCAVFKFYITSIRC